MSKTGVASMPCGATLEVYCWTRDLLGAGGAFLLWNALFSLALGWALVVLPRSDPVDREAVLHQRGGE
jgi:hypothetical protein